MSGRRILVTGGTGIIGAWAVREIAAAGDEPVVLTRGVTSLGRAILGELAEEIEWVEADVAQPLELVAALRRARPEVIAHLASAKPWQMDAAYVERPNPPLGVRTIVDGTVNLLEAARVLEIPRVVYASSKSAYAPFAGPHGHPDYEPVPESFECRPTDVYGITKLAAEQLGRYYAEHLGLDFVALRFASTYGPFKRGAGKAPAGLIGAAIEGRVVEARYTRLAYHELLDEFVYNRDVGRAVQLATAAEDGSGRVFNIGTGVGSSVGDVVAAIGAAGVAVPEIEVVDDDAPGEDVERGHLVANYAGVLDTRAAAQALGFTAAYDLAAGIRDAAEVTGAAAEVRS
ncbi:MAG: NAD(P)-dependent oxidoreductase [Actinobacteria bacterium]|nr:NAD(P)-dependent oxidoreductase [Actinomycetota bacterium]